MLDNLNITLGVSGGIAAYKACDIVSRLKKLGAEVDVVMTKNATKLIQPLTFESLSGRPVSVDTFAKKKNFDIKHISLAKKSDLFFCRLLFFFLFCGRQEFLFFYRTLFWN